MVRKTAKLTGKKTFTFFEEEIPELKDHEILIETISVGLCHSDIPAYFGTSWDSTEMAMRLWKKRFHIPWAWVMNLLEK